MRVEKISISLDAGLGDAARAKLRATALASLLDAWERDHGPFTVEELRRAEAELGLVAEASAR